MPASSNPGAIITGSFITEAALPAGKQRRIFDMGPHMSQMVHKRSEDTLDWLIDLYDWLDLGEIITGCTAQRREGDLTIARLQFAPTGIVIRLSSGTDGTRHTVHVVVTTSTGAVKLIRFNVLTRGEGSPADDVLTVEDVLTIPHYEIWLILGQSNAQGRGRMDPLIETPNPRLFQWGCTPPTTEANPRFQTIFSGSDPLYHPQRINQYTGAASTFARLRLDSLPPSRRLLLLPLAWGGTSLVVPPARWSPTDPGDLLVNAVAQANAALAATRAVYPSSYIKGALWQQGESDGDLEAAPYAAAQDALLAYLRANLTDAANLLFLVGGMTPERIAVGGLGVAAAQRETPARLARTAYVDCPAGYTESGDYLHISRRPGPQILGQRLANAVAYAEANVIGHAPSTPGAITFSAVGNDTFTATVVAPLSRVTNFIWQYRVAPDGPWVSVVPSPSSCYPQRTFTGLARNTPYDVRVKAVNESGESAFSAVASQATTDTFTLAVFGLPVVSSLTNTSASVSAIQASGDPTSTVIAWYRTTETPVAPAGAWVSAVSGGAFPLSITGLMAGTEYEIAVSGNNAAGTGARSVAAVVTTTGTAAAPGAPTDVQAGIVGPGQADLFWLTNATGGRPTSATVQYSDDGGSTWNALPAGSSVGVQEASAIGLPTDRTITFRIRLNNAGGSSAYVSTGATYWADAVAIMAALAAEGDTLTTPQQDAINTFVSACKTDGTWDQIGTMYVGFVSNANAALVDWKAPSARWTVNGTPGFTADLGHVGDGASAWLGNGKTWSAIPGVTQNSAHISVLATATNVTANLAGTNAGGVTRLVKAGSLFVSQINSVATQNTDAWGTGSTLALISRTSPSGYDRYLNGSAVTPAIAASSAPQPSAFSLLRAALSYAPNSATLHAATAGGGLTSAQAATLNSALRALATAFGVP